MLYLNLNQNKILNQKFDLKIFFCKKIKNGIFSTFNIKSNL